MSFENLIRRYKEASDKRVSTEKPKVYGLKSGLCWWTCDSLGYPRTDTYDPSMNYLGFTEQVILEELSGELYLRIILKNFITLT